MLFNMLYNRSKKFRTSTLFLKLEPWASLYNNITTIIAPGKCMNCSSNIV